MSAKGYTNPETDQALNEKLAEIQEEQDEESLPDISPAEAEEARRTLAREDDVDDENPRPDLRVTTTEEFRGHEFEFTEFGGDELKAAEFSDIDDGDVKRGTEAGEYVYEVLGKHGVNTDEEYWRQYSIQPSKGEDGVIELFAAAMDAFADDVDEEALEAAGN